MTMPACIGPVSLSVAEAALGALAQPVIGVERIPLAAAKGRILAEPLLSPLDLPRFDLAAMDGFALAGDAPGGMIVENAMPIRTGAPLPSGADRVVMLEEVERQADRIRCRRLPKRWENVRRAGSELRQGDTVLSAGARVTPATALAAAMVGVDTLSLRRRVRVGFFCTGNEIAPPGTPLAPGQVWNANRPFLASILARTEVDLQDAGDLPDDPGSITAALADLAGCDLIVTTGGSSVGEADHMAAAFRRAGGQFAVRGVALKPGKPVMIGRIGAALWLGLPGTPVAAFTCWHLFGEPLLRGLASLPMVERRTETAAFTAFPRCGRSEVVLVRLERGVAQALPLLPTATAIADGLAILPDTGSELHPGDAITVLPV
ncbi:molybdenum cofactor biosynthesis protein MoaA [Haematobacter missouriensis]|nr:molybdopterin molybdotransferase MoeA [Haematobacter missouriensis]KFI32387.1 molybdenum cofactor biosynthesis protein MoaA [Haematobacter missouriensis]